MAPLSTSMSASIQHIWNVALNSPRQYSALVIPGLRICRLGWQPWRQLLDPDRDRSSPKTEALLQQWEKLHAIRNLTSTIATVLYVYLGVAS